MFLLIIQPHYLTVLLGTKVDHWISLSRGTCQMRNSRMSLECPLRNLTGSPFGRGTTWKRKSLSSNSREMRYFTNTVTHLHFHLWKQYKRCKLRKDEECDIRNVIMEPAKKNQLSLSFDKPHIWLHLTIMSESLMLPLFLVAATMSGLHWGSSLCAL